MKFGPVPPHEALGATAVHTIRQNSLVLKKGTLIGPAEVKALEAAGIPQVVVARLERGDVPEDEAAAAIAAAVAGQGVRIDRAFTGRANLFAENAGVLVVDKDGIDRLNQVDEAITFATLPAFKPVVPGEMIATVKIIPFRGRQRRARRGTRGCQAVLHPCRALQGQKDRRDLHDAAGACGQGRGQDFENHPGAPGSGRSEHRRRTPRAARSGCVGEGAGRSSQRWRRTWWWCSALRRLPTGAT